MILDVRVIVCSSLIRFNRNISCQRFAKVTVIFKQSGLRSITHKVSPEDSDLVNIEILSLLN